MRTFSAGFQSKLDSTTFTPVVFVEYELKEYISGSEPDTGSLITTTYRWSEREITYAGNTYERRIATMSPLTETLDDSNQVFGEMSLQIANHPTNLMTIIQAGMKCTVYLGFEDSIGAGTVTDAEIMFTGTVEGDIEITEDSLSFNVQDIAYSYDSEIPQKIRVRDFPNADKYDIGNPMPLVFGRVKDHLCHSIDGDFSSFLSEDTSASTELGSEFVPAGASDFQQTESSLDNSTTGGYWYAQDKLGYTVTGLSTSDSGNGVIITKNNDFDRSRFIYSNSNIWSPTWASTYINTKWCSTWLISFTIESWQSGWIRLGSEAWKERDDAKTDVANTGSKRWSRKFSPYANDIRNGKANYGEDITYKVVREIDSDNASDSDSLIIEISPDFVGVLKNVSIKPIDVSNSPDYIYVSDDVTHWFRGNTSTVTGSNETHWSGSVTIESKVPELGFGEVPNIPSSESGDDSPQDPPAGSLQYETFGVTNLEFDTSGYRYVYVVSGSPITVEFDAGNKTITRSDGSFITDGFTTDANHFLSSNSPLNGGSRHLTIASVTDTVITVNESIVDEGQGSSTIAEHNYGNPSTYISFSGFDITDAGFDAPFEFEGFEVGQTLTISGSSQNDGNYTITDVDYRTITVDTPLAFESAGSYVFLSVVGTGISVHLDFERRLLDPKNLWKLTLDRPIALDHFVNDIVSLYHNADERFLVADHPVDSITNVRVNDIPVAFTAYPSDSYITYTDYKKRAYIEIDSEEIRNKLGLSLVDDSFLESYQDVNDDINVTDPGHSHTSGGSATYSHQLDVHFKAGFFTEYASPYVKVLSGSFYQTIWSYRSITLNNPISFTSSSPDVIISFANTGLGSVNWDYATCSFMRSDNATGDLIYDYQSRGSGSYSFNLSSNFPPPTDASVVGNSIAEVVKEGNAQNIGDSNRQGSIYLQDNTHNIRTRTGLKVTCDVIGNPLTITELGNEPLTGVELGTQKGYVMPHEQIKLLINKYSRNTIDNPSEFVDTRANISAGYEPIIQNDSNIVNFVNEAEMITAFSKMWNLPAGSSDTPDNTFPRIDTLVQTHTESGATNLSPNAELKNSLLDSSVTIDGYGNPAQQWNVEGFHSLDFSIANSTNWREVLGEMLFHAHCICTWRNGYAYIKYVGDALLADATLDSSDVMMKTMSMNRSPISELTTDVSVKFNRTPAFGYTKEWHYSYEDTGSFGQKNITKLDATRKYGTYSREKNYDLPMVRDQVAAELLAKRIYEEHSDVKMNVGFSTVLKNLAIEVGDHITVSLPIHSDSVLDKGLVTKRVIQFGSATARQADLINLEVRENHISVEAGGGFYLNLEL